MLIPIFVIIGLGMVISIIPLLLYFDITQWRKGFVAHPFLRGIRSGFLLWLATAILLFIDGRYGILLRGESGLAFIAFFPFTLIGFIISGLLVASLYKSRRKPMILRKIKRYPILLAVVFSLMFGTLSGCYGTITGMVVDTETGQPIEGAVVLIEWTKTKGFGLTYTESYKVVEAVTDKDGKVTIAGNFTINPLVNRPSVTVYKKGYVAWNNKFIFPDYKKRTDFKWKNGYVFRIERSKPEYSYNDHISFIHGSINYGLPGNEKKLMEEAIRWEQLKALEERQKAK